MRATFHLLCAILVLPALHAQDAGPAAPENPDWKNLQAAAQVFVQAYNDKDAIALAALMTEDAEMERNNGGRLSGRDAIAAFYEDLFAANPDSKIALEATSLRFLSPTLAIEDGALHVTEAADGEPTSFLYTVLHVRQDDGTWLMARTSDREVANLPAHEALTDVDGLVGDWFTQTPAGSLAMSFTWDESGSYLLGSATYRAAGVDPATITMRIGWDSVREQIVAWTFDSQGGHSKSEWTDAGDRWIVKASGYTGDGELTSSTQILKPTSQDSFTWSVADKIIGGEIQEEQTLHMVRRPPEPKLSD